MADWNLPGNTTSHTVVWDRVKERDDSLARMFDGTLTWSNIPTNTIRLNRTTKKFEQWNGSVWGNPFTEPWLISVDKVDGEDATDFASAVGGAGARVAKDSDQLDAQDSTFYRNASNINAGTLATGRGGTGFAGGYTNGQVLIGNTTGGTLARATIAEGNGIDITNGAGTITITAEVANETNQGISERADQTETNTGSDDTRHVTPLKLNNWDGYTPREATINTQTGATYTFVLADIRKIVEGNRATAQTFTVPPNSTTAFPIGTIIDVSQIGAGTVTVAQGSGVTIRTAETLALAKQYAVATLYKRATDEWVLFGYLGAA